MEIIEVEKTPKQLSACVATIGFFDGVHVGHQFMIDNVIRHARMVGMPSMVVTFSRHPREVVDGRWHPELLSTLAEKVSLLSLTGIDRLALLPFDAVMASLSARDFMSSVLCHKLGACVLLMGYDNHFGHRSSDSTEGFPDYARYGLEMNMTVLRCQPVDIDGIRVSSSKIRQLLRAGDVVKAGHCLGRRYSLTGAVVKGYHIGTQIGYPTANLSLTDTLKLVPGAGVYAVRISIDGHGQWNGMMNIGNRPTFGGSHQTLEVHLLHYSGNLYGHTATVTFVSRLRSEQRFDCAESLAAQLAADARQAEQILNQTP